MVIRTRGVSQKHVDLAVKALELKEALPEGIVHKQEGRRLVYLDDGEMVYVKIQPGKKGVLKNMEHMLRKSYAFHEFDLIERLAEMGVPVVVPLAAAEWRKFPRIFQKSVLITRSAEKQKAEDYLRELYPVTPENQGQRNRLIDSLARFARFLHDKGVLYKDFKLDHVLVDKTPAETGGDFTFVLLDFGSTKIRRNIRPAHIVSEFYRFFAHLSRLEPRDLFTEDDKGRFWREYCKDNPKVKGREEELWRKISQRAELAAATNAERKRTQIRRQKDV